MTALPHNHDAEARLLAVICLDNETMHEVVDALEPSAFDDRQNQTLYRAMRDLYTNRTSINLLTVADAVAGEPDSDELLGRLGQLLEGATTTDLGRARDLTGLIDKAFRLRVIARAGATMANEACAPGADADAVSQAAASQVLALATGGKGQRIADGQEAAQAAIDAFERRRSAPSGIVGLRTGFGDLDRITGGLQPGRLYTVAGTTGMGKTSLATDITGHILINEGKAVLFVSLEMGLDEVTESIAYGRAKVNARQAHTLSEHAVKRFYNVADQINRSSLFVDYSDRVSITQIRARAQRLHMQQSLGLIVVDYLQLADGEASARENRTQEVTKISRGLKALARELNVPVMALSQLSREVDRRPNKRPMLGDLRESGSIEHDSDCVMFVYRDDYYDPHSEKVGLAEIIIGKQRGGGVGTVELSWMPEWSSFRSLGRMSADDPMLVGGAS